MVSEFFNTLNSADYTAPHIKKVRESQIGNDADERICDLTCGTIPPSSCGNCGESQKTVR
jgi:hypothetical protein